MDYGINGEAWAIYQFHSDVKMTGTNAPENLEAWRRLAKHPHDGTRTLPLRPRTLCWPKSFCVLISRLVRPSQNRHDLQGTSIPENLLEGRSLGSRLGLPCGKATVGVTSQGVYCSEGREARTTSIELRVQRVCKVTDPRLPIAIKTEKGTTRCAWQRRSGTCRERMDGWGSWGSKDDVLKISRARRSRRRGCARWCMLMRHSVLLSCSFPVWRTTLPTLTLRQQGQCHNVDLAGHRFGMSVKHKTTANVLSLSLCLCALLRVRESEVGMAVAGGQGGAPTPPPGDRISRLAARTKGTSEASCIGNKQ